MTNPFVIPCNHNDFIKKAQGRFAQAVFFLELPLSHARRITSKFYPKWCLITFLCGGRTLSLLSSSLSSHPEEAFPHAFDAVHMLMQNGNYHVLHQEPKKISSAEKKSCVCK
jgi:hypothetical protein